MPNFKKGSPEAKAFMAKLRASRGTSKVGKAKAKPKRKGLFVKKLAVYARPTKSGKVKPYVRKISGFETTYKNAPADVKKILDGLDFMEDYGKLEKAKKALMKKGYYLDYGLDGAVTEFRKVRIAKKVGARKLSENELIAIASDYAYVMSADLDKVTWRLLDPDYTDILLPKYKAAIKDFEKKYKIKVTPKMGAVKKTPMSKHKDMNSHNVNIKVVSGIDMKKIILEIDALLKYNQELERYITMLKDRVKNERNPLYLQTQKRSDVKTILGYKELIADNKKHITALKKYIK